VSNYIEDLARALVEHAPRTGRKGAIMREAAMLLEQVVAERALLSALHAERVRIDQLERRTGTLEERVESLKRDAVRLKPYL
jgi:hypothetical protein